MGIRNFPYVTMGFNTSKRVTVSGPSRLTLAEMTNGILPKYTLFAVTPGTATGNVIYISPSIDLTNGNETNWPIFCDKPPFTIFNTFGQNRVQRAESGDGTSLLFIVPLEDF